MTSANWGGGGGGLGGEGKSAGRTGPLATDHWPPTAQVPGKARSRLARRALPFSCAVFFFLFKCTTLTPLPPTPAGAPPSQSQRYCSQSAPCSLTPTLTILSYLRSLTSTRLTAQSTRRCVYRSPFAMQARGERRARAKSACGRGRGRAVPPRANPPPPPQTAKEWTRKYSM